MRKQECWESLNREFRSFRGIEPKGFTERLANDVANRTNCHRDVAEACGLAAISTLGSNIKLFNKKGLLRLNLWQIIIGESGSGKNLPLTYVDQLLGDLEKKVREILGRENYKLRGPTDFSPEGVAKRLAKKDQNGQPLQQDMIIIKHEASEIVKNMSKAYQANSLENYCNLHDGTRVDRQLVEREDEFEKHYITFLGATTESIYQSMPREFFSQGTGNRFLPIVFESNSAHDRLDFDDFFHDGQHGSFDSETYLHDLIKLIALGEINAKPNREAGELWIDYEWGKEEERLLIKGQQNADLNSIYLHRMPEIALKLATLASVGKSLPDLRRGESLIIDLADMQWAIGKTETVIDYHNKMVDDWYSSQMDRQADAIRAVMVKLRRAFDDAPDGFLTQKEISHRTGFGMNSQLTDNIVSAMAHNVIEKIEPDDVQSLPEEVRKRHRIKVGGAGNHPAGYRLVQPDGKG